MESVKSFPMTCGSFSALPYPAVSARGPDKWNQLHFQVASVAFLSPAKSSLMREHVCLVRTKSWTRAEST